MGLKSDKYGVKSQLKIRYKEAFKEFSTLVDARDASLVSRKESFTVIDGNVLMMSVPQSARKLEDYVAILTSMLKKTVATSKVTTVVYDDPDCLTVAKKQEQKRRDDARKSTQVVSSFDLKSSLPEDDDYLTQDMECLPDVHVLVHNRCTRLRFFDEVSMRVFRNLTNQIERWKVDGFEGGCIMLDGIDPRGGSRPCGHPRSAQFVSSLESMKQVFERDVPIGEGDLKLAYVGRRARHLSMQDNEVFKDIKLSMCVTIDTESFAIELLEEAKRLKERADPSKKQFNTLLCMRERARKRGMDDDKEATYLCCDISMLYKLLQDHMWGFSRAPSVDDRHASMTLMCIGWAMGGCDFMCLKGLRSDVVFDCVPLIVNTMPSVIEQMKLAFTGNRADALLLKSPLVELSKTCASKLCEMPRNVRLDISSIRHPDDIILSRACWLSCYWNGIEHTENMGEFGFFTPSSL